MTKEELENEARERADKIEKRQKRCRYSIDESYVAGYEDGYIEGAKAHSVKWHKKDEPPKGPINRLLLGCVKYYNSKKYKLVGWNSEWWYDANTFNKKVNLIAWCEIPKMGGKENDKEADQG